MPSKTAQMPGSRPSNNLLQLSLWPKSKDQAGRRATARVLMVSIQDSVCKASWEVCGLGSLG